MNVSASVCSNLGRVRKNNEDNFFLNGLFMQKEAMDGGGSFSRGNEQPLQLYAVCDGMGGESAGEEASFAAVSHMADLLYNMRNGTPVHNGINEYTEKTNSAILAMGGGGHIGTTMTMLCAHDDMVTVAHLGDSRIYLLRKGALSQLTQDHSEVNRLISIGLITPEEAKTHPLRNAILRYLGMNSGEIRVTPTFLDIVPQKGDRFLLCSDGVTDMLEDDRICAALAAGTPEQAANTIVQLALQAGGVDNTTALVVEIEKTGGDMLSKSGTNKVIKYILLGIAAVVALSVIVLCILLISRLIRRDLPVAVDPTPHPIVTLPTEEPIVTPQATVDPTLQPIPTAQPTTEYSEWSVWSEWQTGLVDASNTCEVETDAKPIKMVAYRYFFFLGESNDGKAVYAHSAESLTSAGHSVIGRFYYIREEALSAAYPINSIYCFIVPESGFKVYSETDEGERIEVETEDSETWYRYRTRSVIVTETQPTPHAPTMTPAAYE